MLVPVLVMVLLLVSLVWALLPAPAAVVNPMPWIDAIEGGGCPVS
jgi:hypothetical protein